RCKPSAQTQRGAAVTKTTTRVLAGAAVTALGAAGVAAVIRYRQGQKPDPEERAHLDELEARLYEIEEPDKNIPPSGVSRVVERLQRDQGISVARLRQWIAGLRPGTLSSGQAMVPERDCEALGGGGGWWAWRSRERCSSQRWTTWPVAGSGRVRFLHCGRGLLPARRPRHRWAGCSAWCLASVSWLRPPLPARWPDCSGCDRRRCCWDRSSAWQPGSDCGLSTRIRRPRGVRTAVAGSSGSASAALSRAP